MTSNTNYIAGVHAVTELLKQRSGDVRRLLIKKGRHDSRVQGLLELAQKAGIEVQELELAELEKRCPSAHQGVVAETARARPARSEADLNVLLDSLHSDALLLILDGVTDPHNLGACLRTADAAGVNAVIVPKDKSASLNDTVSRVASGAAESMPLVTVTNLARCMKSLQERGIWLIGTADAADHTLYQQDLTGPIALVMGSEGSGLRRLTREHCDHLVSIPMAGTVSSLNVSVATGVALFEAVRQRS